MSSSASRVRAHPCLLLAHPNRIRHRWGDFRNEGEAMLDLKTVHSRDLQDLFTPPEIRGTRTKVSGQTLRAARRGRGPARRSKTADRPPAFAAAGAAKTGGPT